MSSFILGFCSCEYLCPWTWIPARSHQLWRFRNSASGKLVNLYFQLIFGVFFSNVELLETKPLDFPGMFPCSSDIYLFLGRNQLLTFVGCLFSRQTPAGLISPKQLCLFPETTEAQAEPRAVNPKSFIPWRIPSPDTFSDPSNVWAPGEFIAHFMSYWVGWTRDSTVIEF